MSERIAIMETEMVHVKGDISEMKTDMKIMKDAVTGITDLVNEMHHDRIVEKEFQQTRILERRKERRENKMFFISLFVTVLLAIAGIYFT